MTAQKMTVNERILSYLKNRKGKPVPPSEVAVGARLKRGTVGTQLAKLIDAGQVIRVSDTFPIGGGRDVPGVVHADYRALVKDRIVERIKPMPYAALKACADAFEIIANLVVTRGTGDPEVHGTRAVDPLITELAKMRDSYRDLKHRGILPGSNKQRVGNPPVCEACSQVAEGPVRHFDPCPRSVNA